MYALHRGLFKHTICRTPPALNTLQRIDLPNCRVHPFRSQCRQANPDCNRSTCTNATSDHFSSGFFALVIRHGNLLSAMIVAEWLQAIRTLQKWHMFRKAMVHRPYSFFAWIAKAPYHLLQSILPTASRCEAALFGLRAIRYP